MLRRVDHAVAVRRWSIENDRVDRPLHARPVPVKDHRSGHHGSAVWRVVCNHHAFEIANVWTVCSHISLSQRDGWISSLAAGQNAAGCLERDTLKGLKRSSSSSPSSMSTVFLPEGRIALVWAPWSVNQVAGHRTRREPSVPLGILTSVYPGTVRTSTSRSRNVLPTSSV